MALDRPLRFRPGGESYRLAAEAIEGRLYPTGEVACGLAPRSVPGSLQFRRLHPSNLGTYAAALAIVGVIYDRSPVGLPTLGVPAATALLLQESAAEAIAAIRAASRP